MGYIRHHAIVVTGYCEKDISKAQTKAKKLSMAVSNIVESPLNGYFSFFVAPDGSKEGWAESAAGDETREDFINYLNSMRYSDTSSPLSWIEMFYGDEENKASIVQHDDHFIKKSLINTPNGDV